MSESSLRVCRRLHVSPFSVVSGYCHPVTGGWPQATICTRSRQGITSGIDLELKRLRKLQAIRSNQQKKVDKAVRSIEFYWEQVFAAIEENNNLEDVA